MRWKYEGPADPNAYRCCLCCHVRTGTIFLGLFHLMVHIIVLSLFAVVVLHPDLVQDQDGLSVATDVESMGTDDNFSSDNIYVVWFKTKDLSSEDKFVGLLLTMGSFFVTVLLVYGAAKGQAGYLMPFFCVQVFDFCVSCLTIVGYFSYMPDIKQWIAQQDGLPFQKELLTMDTDWLMLTVIIFFIIILTIKAYFIGIVWSCYKFLSSFSMQPGSMARNYGGSPEDTEMLLPPKYEDAIRMSQEEPPPPPYYPA